MISVVSRSEWARVCRQRRLRWTPTYRRPNYKIYLHSVLLFAILECMFQSDIDAETEWFLTASDEDLLNFETTDAAIHSEPAAIRSAV